MFVGFASVALFARPTSKLFAAFKSSVIVPPAYVIPGIVVQGVDLAPPTTVSPFSVVIVSILSEPAILFS
jgi:hypothetical protein